MVFIRRGLTLAAAAVMILSTVLGAQKKDDKKQTDAQKKETLDIVKLADAASAGQPLTNDLGLAWAHEDFLKATGNKEYVPFTLTYDPAKIASGSNVALYWRVVAKDAAAPVATVPLTNSRLVSLPDPVGGGFPSSSSPRFGLRTQDSMCSAP